MYKILIVVIRMAYTGAPSVATTIAEFDSKEEAEIAMQAIYSASVDATIEALRLYK